MSKIYRLKKKKIRAVLRPNTLLMMMMTILVVESNAAVRKKPLQAHPPPLPKQNKRQKDQKTKRQIQNPN